MWGNLVPLMKQEVLSDQNILTDKKKHLFDLVLLKDNVGEAFWYIYSGMLVSSIVYYYLSVKPCVKDISTIKNEYNSYISEHGNTKTT